jgi:hypothetical protein
LTPLRWLSMGCAPTDFHGFSHAETRNRPLRVGATHGEATKPSEASAERGRERRDGWFRGACPQRFRCYAAKVAFYKAFAGSCPQGFGVCPRQVILQDHAVFAGKRCRRGGLSPRIWGLSPRIVPKDSQGFLPENAAAAGSVPKNLLDSRGLSPRIQGFHVSFGRRRQSNIR